MSLIQQFTISSRTPSSPTQQTFVNAEQISGLICTDQKPTAKKPKLLAIFPNTMYVEMVTRIRYLDTLIGARIELKETDMQDKVIIVLPGLACLS